MTKKMALFLLLSHFIPQATVALPNLKRIGTNYGGWTIPADLLNTNSVCYCVGAGEDISFDIGIVNLFDCNIHIFDPTPRAIKHVKYVINALNNNKPSYTTPREIVYKLNLDKIDKIFFYPIGLWHQNETLKFYTPKNPKHVSHSITNLQKTDNYFTAQCKRLSTIMSELGHDHIDLLKLDIEGAEYVVIDSIIEDRLDITCMCIEFHKPTNSKESVKNNPVVKSYIQKILNLGYEIIDRSEFPNITFLKIN